MSLLNCAISGCSITETCWRSTWRRRSLSLCWSTTSKRFLLARWNVYLHECSECYTITQYTLTNRTKLQDRMLDRLCDILTFGALEPCAECNGGQLVYQSGITSDLEKGPFLVPISKPKFLAWSFYWWLLQVSVIDVRAIYLNGQNARLSWIANSSYSEWCREIFNRWNLWILAGGSSKYQTISSKNLTFWPCTRLSLAQKSVQTKKKLNPKFSEQGWHSNNPQLAWHTPSTGNQWQLQWNTLRVGKDWHMLCVYHTNI